MADSRQPVDGSIPTVDVMTSTDFVLSPIAPRDADELRRNATIVHIADQEHSFPCRQCLRDAAIGEELVLVSHDPFDADSPYRSASPIYLHRRSCGEPADAPGVVPDQQRRRVLAVRAFDDSAMMLDAAIIDGAELAATARTMLTIPGVDHLQVHNATRGCWAVRIDRV